MSEHHHPHGSSAALSQRVNGLVAQLERRALLLESEIEETVEQFLLHASPSNGFHLVARAWVDPEFKRLLLDDANAAIQTFGLDLSHWSPVKVRCVENTETTHNIIVCTLCSCYPIALLGPSPKWYKSDNYRARVVRDPRDVLGEFGVTLSANTRIDVWDSTSELRYMVIPRRPAGTEHLCEDELAALITRNGLIGTALLEGSSEGFAPRSRYHGIRHEGESELSELTRKTFFKVGAVAGAVAERQDHRGEPRVAGDALIELPQRIGLSIVRAVRDLALPQQVVADDHRAATELRKQRVEVGLGRKAVILGADPDVVHVEKQASVGAAAERGRGDVI